MARRRISFGLLALVSLAAASCASDPTAAPAAVATSSASLDSTPPTTIDSSTTTTTEPPTSTQGVDLEPFVPTPAPSDIASCSPDSDLYANYEFLASPQELSVKAVFVVNVSDSPCSLSDPGFIVRGKPVPVGPADGYQAGSPVLARGDAAVFILTSSRRTFAPGEELDLDATDYAQFGLGDDYLTDPDAGVYIGVDDPSFVGPVEWTGSPHAPTVLIPVDPASGAPIGHDDLVTTAGLGSFRAGMSPQELVDSTGSPFVIREWNEASDGCGYGWLRPGLVFTIAGPTRSLDDAIVGAVVDTDGRRTPSGLGVGTSVAQLRDSLGDDRLATRVNQYTDVEDYLFTPKDPGESHLGMFFRISLETGLVEDYEAGLMTQIGRGEGCA